MARDILLGTKTTIKVPRSETTEIYKHRYNEDLSADIETDIDPVPQNYKHTQEELFELIERLESSIRYNDEEVYLDRLEKELTFFDKTDNVKFLLKVSDLIEKFKRDGVVWGVGRGSGSASYTLFLLEVHDIDPVQYKIPFYELSKEFD